MKHWFCNYIYHPERARENEVAHNNLIQEDFKQKKKLPTELTNYSQNDSFINNSYFNKPQLTLVLKSVENQSVLPDEILIADDGSRRTKT
jgi:hypothetical protein